MLHLCHLTPMSANLMVPTDLGLNVPAEFRDALEARQRLRASCRPGEVRS